jgi:hypothetical protein
MHTRTPTSPSVARGERWDTSVSTTPASKGECSHSLPLPNAHPPTPISPAQRAYVFQSLPVCLGPGASHGSVQFLLGGLPRRLQGRGVLLGVLGGRLRQGIGLLLLPGRGGGRDGTSDLLLTLPSGGSHSCLQSSSVFSLMGGRGGWSQRGWICIINTIHPSTHRHSPPPFLPCAPVLLCSCAPVPCVRHGRQIQMPCRASRTVNWDVVSSRTLCSAAATALAASASQACLVEATVCVMALFKASSCSAAAAACFETKQHGWQGARGVGNKNSATRECTCSAHSNLQP